MKATSHAGVYTARNSLYCLVVIRVVRSTALHQPFWTRHLPLPTAATVGHSHRKHIMFVLTTETLPKKRKRKKLYIFGY